MEGALAGRMPSIHEKSCETHVPPPCAGRGGLPGVPMVGVPGKLLKFGFSLPVVLTKADEWQVMQDA